MHYTRDGSSIITLGLWFNKGKLITGKKASVHLLLLRDSHNGEVSSFPDPSPESG